MSGANSSVIDCNVSDSFSVADSIWFSDPCLKPGKCLGTSHFDLPVPMCGVPKNSIANVDTNIEWR